MTSVWTAALADAGETARTASIGPGLTAFLIVVGLFVATYFLVRSMLKQIKKVPPTFDGEQPASAPGPVASTETDPVDATSADAEPDDAR